MVETKGFDRIEKKIKVTGFNGMEKDLTRTELKTQSLSKQAERLPWLDVLKGIGIILVAIGHIYHNQVIFNWLYSFHMPLFFFAAG